MGISFFYLTNLTKDFMPDGYWYDLQGSMMIGKKESIRYYASLATVGYPKDLEG